MDYHSAQDSFHALPHTPLWARKRPRCALRSKTRVAANQASCSHSGRSDAIVDARLSSHRFEDGREAPHVRQRAISVAVSPVLPAMPSATTSYLIDIFFVVLR